MLIIDEQSMILSTLLATADRNVEDCVFQNKLWSSVPIVLIFGDDYQLFPVIKEGAIKGYAKRQELWEQTESKKSPDQQLLIGVGN